MLNTAHERAVARNGIAKMKSALEDLQAAGFAGTYAMESLGNVISRTKVLLDASAPTFDAVLRDAVIIGEGSHRFIYGKVYEQRHGRFPDGQVISTSKIAEELGDGLYKTKSGTIYLVELQQDVADAHR